MTSAAGIISQELVYQVAYEVNKRAAGSYYTPRLFSERTRKLARFLARFG